ncbi:related to SAM binding motif containing protein [Ramularia collo-cygni]|uniref:Related to SAM binding motif containing protein n=1 Tax=Ramularia collo-cygni TaxID=112498 RepID=A0A2D3VLI3_9PEZI|nr:related to SAM binding motif containing protein [Ramularia collo-cygni]CZT23394.1 related to SAM binding motif containing protein [Ramularia collo-cygni]
MDGFGYAHLLPKEPQTARLSPDARASSREPSLHSQEDPDRAASHGSISAPQKTRTAKRRESIRGLLRRDGFLGEARELYVPHYSSAASSRASSTMSSAPIPLRQTVTNSEPPKDDTQSGPFELRHGRRYLRDAAYPLPVDLAELTRQTLRTLLAVQAFGKPICSPVFAEDIPQRILEIGCGSGFWSATCHDHYAALGHDNIEFVGMDIAPLAPDLRKQGVNWKFVQHDIRVVPWPFEENSFDLIMAKDLSLVMPLALETENILAAIINYIRPGGVLEVWDGDHVIRSLHPNTPVASRKKPQEQFIAEQTATFSIPPGHPFLPTQSKHLQQANAWIMQSLFARDLHPVPCVRIAEIMLTDDKLGGFGNRRVAVPLGGLKEERGQWEGWKDQRSMSSTSGRSTPSSQSIRSGRESPAPSLQIARSGHDSPMSTSSMDPLKVAQKPLTPDQAALRQTALITVLQFIQSMEPLLREVSGKTSDEWTTWCSGMMTELLDPSQAGLSGECLELGAWWTHRLPLTS